MHGSLKVRPAEPVELAALADLRVAAYRALGTLHPAYVDHLRALGLSGPGEVLVAVDGDRLVGTVMLDPFHPGSEIATGQDEAEIRALAVAPEAQRRGVGRALLTAVIERATATRVRHLLLSTKPEMVAGRHLYETAGFHRLPERDWFPLPGVTLLAYALPLPVPRRDGAC